MSKPKFVSSHDFVFDYQIFVDNGKLLIYNIYRGQPINILDYVFYADFIL